MYKLRILLDKIEEIYYQDLLDDLKFQEIFIFIRDKILDENEAYNEKDVKTLLLNIKEDYFVDNKKIVQSLKNEKVDNFYQEYSKKSLFDKKIGLDQYI